MAVAIEKLSGMPTLRVTDIMFVNKIDESAKISKKNKLHPRRYTTTWEIANTLHKAANLYNPIPQSEYRQNHAQH